MLYYRLEIRSRTGTGLGEFFWKRLPIIKAHSWEDAISGSPAANAAAPTLCVGA